MKTIKRIGLGTFPFGGVFGEVSEKNIEIILNQFLDFGGNLIQVAPLYQLGGVESMFGRLLKKIPRENYTLMTCCGWNTENGKLRLGASYKDIISSCEQSIERLGIEQFDIYMLHLPDVNIPYNETMDAISELKLKGVIKEICVSNVSIEQLKGYNCYKNINYVQNRVSYVNRTLSKEFKQYCCENDIKIDAYQVIERGLLTSRVLQDNFNFAENDLRLKKPEFSEKLIKNEFSDFVAQKLKPIADELNISIATLVTKWLLDCYDVRLAMYGISKVKYFDDVLNVDSTENLPKDIVSKLEKAYKDFEILIRHKHDKSIRGLMKLE